MTLLDEHCSDMRCFKVVIYFSGFSVSIGFTDSSNNKTDVGPVLIDYFNQVGEICEENFDDRDAIVICRQLGFVDGFSYR